MNALRSWIALPVGLLLAGCSAVSPFMVVLNTANDVPWVAATVAPNVAPTPEPIPSGAMPCDISRLGITVVAGGGGGTVEGQVLLTSPPDQQPCFLSGPPAVVGIRLEDGSRDVPVQYVTRARPGPGDKAVHPTPQVLLGDGSDAQELFIWSNWCGDPDAKIRFLFRTDTSPHGATGISNATYGAPRCDQPALRTRITGYEFRHPPTDEVSLDLALYLPEQATVGRPLVYGVTITNNDGRPARLAPCPAYQEDLVLPKPPGPHVERWLLNCDALPHVLWPGDSRALVMQIDVPADAPSGPASISWMFFSDVVDGMTDSPVVIVAP